MKISDESVYNFKVKAGINKNTSFSIIGANFAKFFSNGLKRANSSGANSENFTAGLLNAVDGFGGGWSDFVSLGVHSVLSDVFNIDWAEGAEANMKGNFNDFNAFGFSLTQEFRGKM